MFAGVIVNKELRLADPKFAVIEAVDALDTADVVTRNDAVDCPAGIITVTGGVAMAELLLRLIVLPDGPAKPERVTIPVDFVPPITALGERVSEVRIAGVTVIEAFCVLVPWVAVMLTEVETETGLVETLNVAEVEPAATMTELGTDVLRSEETRLMANPPFGAGPERLTVPVALDPPCMLVGEMERPERVTGPTVSGALKLLPPWVAVRVTIVEF